MTKEYRFPNQVTQLLKRCLLHTIILVAALIALFGPWQNRLFEWLPYLEKHGAEIFVVFLFVWLVALVRFFLRGAISVISVDGDAIQVTYSSYFSEEPISKKDFLVEDIFYIGNRGSSLALVTTKGRLELGSSSVMNEFVDDFQNTFLLNKAHYLRLDISRLYDLFQALPAGKQAELVGEVINEKTEAEAHKRQQEFCAPRDEAEPAIREGNVEAYSQLRDLQELSFVVCPRCAGETLVCGALLTQQPVHFEPENAKASGLQRFLHLSFPVMESRIMSCLLCGLIIGQTRPEVLQEQVRKYGSEELRAMLDAQSD